jgi:hypothetical protein
MSKSTESISKGIDTSTKNPGLFVPALAPLAIQLLFLILAYVVFPYQALELHGLSLRTVYYPNIWISLAGSFIAAIVGFLASCMIVDMANDVINGRPMDMKKSMNLVTGKLGTLIAAAIISAVCYITIILIPVAMFIIAIALIEGTDAIESTKRAFDFVVKNLGEVIVYIIIVIVINVVLAIGIGLIPVVGIYIGNAASWIINVIFTVASVHFYLASRLVAPPPPPPPPPPL